MIKASELRIGNFIYDDEGIISKVVGFKPFDYSVRCDEEEGCDLIIINYGQDGSVRGPYDLDSNLVERIPFTPEWLERCGFQKKSNEMQIDGMEMTFHIDDSTYFSSCGGLNETLAALCLCRGNYFANNLQFVHELQNLYFALTGEELTIKL